MKYYGAARDLITAALEDDSHQPATLARVQDPNIKLVNAIALGPIPLPTTVVTGQ